MVEDTIAAISTPIGAAGIGIIRVSGPNSLTVVEKIFRSSKKRRIRDAKNFSLLHGYIFDKEQLIDEVLVSVMRGPRSFTGENVVEINCHGGIVAVKKVLETVFRAGARPAEPGEFSKRAFLNGRIDLAQAEAIMDLINAKTEKSLKIAVKQLEGGLSKEIKKLREDLIGLIAHIEAGIDFPEHDIEELSRVQIKRQSESILEKINKLIESADTGKVFREGLRTVIVGKPNVGKSSLLNALLKEKRAIVTDIPGTTRDVIEEIVNIRGIPIKIVDTAGIRETEDTVEKIGVEKTKEMFQEADLILLMIDAHSGITDEDKKIISLVKGKNLIVIINKIDIKKNLNISELKGITDKDDFIEMSLVEEKGIETLKKKIEDLVYEGFQGNEDEIISTNARQKNALINASDSIKRVISGLDDGLPLDLMDIDLNEALNSLGEISGDSLTEDIVEEIFSRFCIGK